MKLTKPQLEELKAQNKEPQYTYGRHRAKVQNVLIGLGLSKFRDRRLVRPDEPGDMCCITDAGRAELVKVLSNKVKVKFCLQPTHTFRDGAPAREEYDSDEQHENACRVYEGEWLQEYECTGCRNGDCPQHGPALMAKVAT